jgi:hypothetical protein
MAGSVNVVELEINIRNNVRNHQLFVVTLRHNAILLAMPILVYQASNSD